MAHAPLHLEGVRSLRDHEGRGGVAELVEVEGIDLGFRRSGRPDPRPEIVVEEVATLGCREPAQAVKTLVHELGHALLHSEALPRSKEVAEVEVESVAYIVCDAIGLDSGDYSFAYVARWSEGSSELLKETGERAIGCAKQVLDRLVVSSDAAGL